MSASSSDYLYICTRVGTRYVSRKISLADLKTVVNLSGDGGGGSGGGSGGGDSGGDSGGDKYNFKNLEFKVPGPSLKKLDDGHYAFYDTINKGEYTFPCNGRLILAVRYNEKDKTWENDIGNIYLNG